MRQVFSLHLTSLINRYLRRRNQRLFGVVLLSASVLGLLWIQMPKEQSLQEMPQRPDSAEKKTAVERTETLDIRPKPSKSKQRMEVIFTDEELAKPETQKLLEILDSPEYQAFSDTHPAGIEAFLDFFKGHGIPVNKKDLFALYEEEFQKHFPQKRPTELEAEMRSKLSTLFVQSNIVIGTAAGLQAFVQSLETFLETAENVAWMNRFFQGNSDAFSDWAVEVFRNPTHSPVLPMPMDPHAPSDETFDRIAIDSSVEQFDGAPLDRGRHEGETSTFEKTNENNNRETHDINKVRPPTLLPISPLRSHRAIQTLSQYGAEEGIRRLKESDPEVAEQVARMLEKHRRTTE